MKLQSKVAVVTGGGSGFGEGIAQLLAEHGTFLKAYLSFIWEAFFKPKRL